MPILTRSAQSSDIPALRRIWTEAFGIGDDEDFFSFYFDPELCVTADHDGVPAAAGYLIPFGNLICCGTVVPCAMIYAAAVLPELRSHGFGTYIVRDLIKTGQSSGYPAIILCPSEDSLFDYYSTRSALRDWFYVSEQRMNTVELQANSVTNKPDAPPSLSRVSADEYIMLRESLLQNIPHITVNADAMKYQEILCKSSGGGLFKISSPAGESCAIVEAQPDGSVSIKELLSHEGSESALLASIVSAFPAPEYMIRMPAPIEKQPSVSINAVKQHNTETPYKGTISASIHAAIQHNTEAPYKGIISSPEISTQHGTRGVVRRFGMLAESSGILFPLKPEISYELPAIAPWYGPAFD